MTASALWSDAPKNRYAAERMGLSLTMADRPDAHAARRHATRVLAGLFLLVNMAVLASLAPAMMDSITALVTLPDLSAP